MRFSSADHRSPPGPNLPGLIWQVQSWFAMLETLESWHREFGDIFRLPNDRYEYFCVASPSGLDTIFKASSSVIGSSQKGGIFDAILGTNALLCLEGKPHQQHRRLMLPPFHGTALQQWTQQIYDTAQTMLRHQPATPLLLRPLIQEMTLTTLLQVVFGDRPALITRLYTLLQDLFAGVESPLTAIGIALQLDLGEWSPWGAFHRRQTAIRVLLLEEIRAFRQAPAQPDMFALLMQARDEDGNGLSEAELQDELLTLCFAGYETTTSALVWMLYWIYSRPDVEQRLRLELREALGSVAAIPRLAYLTAVCQESLRLYPVAIGAFTRQVLAPLEIDGFCLPVGSFIHPSIYLAHRRASVYPDPSQFKPERFLERQFSNYEYLPFGGGNRRCIGAEFAQLQMKLIAAAFLQTIAVHLDKGNFWEGPLKPVRYGMTMAPPPHLRIAIQAVH